ncbi:MAG TPA: TlpA disulfide reductase family protein [Planctomycetota bacterium]|nr:TlpA disulfide reductase family protein [Planctomycetota bacterium]
MRLTVSSAVLAALSISALAQETPKTTRDTNVSAIAARKAQMTVKLTSAAAASQFASIRTSLQTMLTEVALSTDPPELTTYGEEELLKIWAVRLEEFIRQFKGTKEAEGARSLLARIYVKLKMIDAAVRILKDLDADSADQSDLLQIALAAGDVVELSDTVNEYLKVVAAEGDVFDKRLDAVFVATRLNKWDLASALLESIRKDVKTPADKAALAVAEADLISRLGINSIIPVNTPTKATTFMVDALIAAKLNANETAVGSWRNIKPAPVEASYNEKLKAIEDQRRRDEQLKHSAIYKQIVLDAAAGLRTLVALKPVDGTIKIPIDGGWAPNSDGSLPTYMPPVDVVAKALLYGAVHQYPGTDAAKEAAIKLHADNIQVGDQIVPFATNLIDGTVLTSSDLVGKVVLLDFFSVSDYDSLAERQKLTRLYESYRAQGFEIVSVSLDSDADRGLVLQAADGFDMDWKIVFDGKGVHADLAKKYGVQAVPARLLIAADGTVFEDQAWQLSPDELEVSITNALAKPKKPLPVSDWAYLVEKNYYGPKIQVSLKPSDDGTQVVINADAWVADAGYKLVVIKVDPKPDGVKVYLGLELQQWQSNADLKLLNVKVPVAADILKVAKLVKIYVDHKAAGVVDEPLLAKVIPIEPTSIAPMWPNIEIELISTDSLPPEYTAVLHTDLLSDQYAVDVDSVKPVDGITQIKLIVKPKPQQTGDNGAPVTNSNKANTGDEYDKEPIQLVIPLGIDVCKTIDVLVATVNVASGRIGPYSVVARTTR